MKCCEQPALGGLPSGTNGDMCFSTLTWVAADFLVFVKKKVFVEDFSFYIFLTRRSSVDDFYYFVELAFGRLGQWCRT